MNGSVRHPISNASALTPWNDGGKGCREPSRTIPTSHRTAATATRQGEFELLTHRTTLSLSTRSQTVFVQSEVDPTIAERVSRMGPNPTGTSVTELVHETLPLNQKHFLVVRKILSHAIKHHGKPTLEAEDQMLLAVTGERGVGKTRVIKAVELGFELRRRKEEVILLAPTGVAAYNIGGRTIHTALSINMCDRARPSVTPQIYSLWQGKTILFIDEISMVSLNMRQDSSGWAGIYFHPRCPPHRRLFGRLPPIRTHQGSAALADTERSSSHPWTAGLAPLHRRHHPRRTDEAS